MAVSKGRMDGLLRLCSNIARRCGHWLLSTSNAIDARLARSTVDVPVALQPQICQRERITHWIREPSALRPATSSSFNFHKQLLRNLSESNDLPTHHQIIQRHSSGDEIASLVVQRQEVVEEVPTGQVPSSDEKEETVADIMARSPASTWLAYLKLTGLSPKKAKPSYAALSKSELASLEQHMQRREALARLVHYPSKLTPTLKKQYSSLQAAREQWTKSAAAKRPLHSLIQEIAQRLDTEVLSQHDRLQLLSDYNSLLCLKGDRSTEGGVQQSRKKKSFG